MSVLGPRDTAEKKKKMTGKVVPILKSLYSSQGDKK